MIIPIATWPLLAFHCYPKLINDMCLSGDFMVIEDVRYECVWQAKCQRRNLPGLKNTQRFETQRGSKPGRGKRGHGS